MRADEVVVMVQLQFKPGAAEHIVERMIPIVRQTRQEPGNVDFQFFRVKGQEDRFVLVERWTDQAALETHWQLPHTKEALAMFDRHLVRSLSEVEDVTYLDDLMSQPS